VASSKDEKLHIPSHKNNFSVNSDFADQTTPSRDKRSTMDGLTPNETLSL